MGVQRREQRFAAVGKGAGARWLANGVETPRGIRDKRSCCMHERRPVACPWAVWVRARPFDAPLVGGGRIRARSHLDKYQGTFRLLTCGAQDHSRPPAPRDGSYVCCMSENRPAAAVGRPDLPAEVCASRDLLTPGCRCHTPGNTHQARPHPGAPRDPPYPQLDAKALEDRPHEAERADDGWKGLDEPQRTHSRCFFPGSTRT